MPANVATSTAAVDTRGRCIACLLLPGRWDCDCLRQPAVSAPHAAAAAPRTKTRRPLTTAATR